MNLVCKCCGQKFHISESCPKCSRRPELKNNTYLFDDKAFFYGDPPREVLRKTASMNNDIISPLVTLDYYDHLYEPQRHIGKYLGDPRRVAPVAYLNKKALKRASVLDYGCGLGVFTMTLAEHCQEVCALDATLERAEFSRSISSYLSNTNVITAKGALDSSFFFAEGQFDLIILNGVLEWTPVTMDTTRPPRDVLVGFLTRIKRFLKPNGVIYVGIENRYALNYFLGSPDHHSGLLFGSLLPRTMANIYSKYLKHTPYRTYTFSHGGYRRLFNDAGLNILLATFMYPSYQFPTYIGKTDQYLGFFKKELCEKNLPGRKMKLIRTLSQLPFSDAVFRRTAPAYGFFISAATTTELVTTSTSFYYLSQDGYAQSQLKNKRQYQKLSSKLWINSNEPFEIQKKMREQLNRLGRSDLASLIPAIEREGNIWNEDIVPGKQMVEDLKLFRINGPSDTFKRLYHNALCLMTEIYRVIREPQDISFVDFAKEWLKINIAPYHFSETAKLFDEISRIISQTQDNMMVHLSPIHGNFSPRNILCHDGKVTAFIDWAMAESRSAYEVDMMDGLYCYHRFVLGQETKNTNFFVLFRDLHRRCRDSIDVALPISPIHVIYLFVAIRNTINRGRGCFINTDELKSLVDAWKGYVLSDVFSEEAHRVN